MTRSEQEKSSSRQHILPELWFVWGGGCCVCVGFFFFFSLTYYYFNELEQTMSSSELGIRAALKLGCANSLILGDLEATNSKTLTDNVMNDTHSLVPN